MRDHTRLRAFELADEVALLIYRASAVTNSLQPKHLSRYGDYCYSHLVGITRRDNMSLKLMDYFNKQPRLGTLSTADKQGKVDCAVLGSPRMLDGKTVVMTLRKNRTFSNLQENPFAVFSIMEPGKTSAEWKGIRVYLKMIDCQTAGEKLETMRGLAAQRLGEANAKLIHAAVTLEVYDVRPMIDLGQGWEGAI